MMCGHQDLRSENKNGDASHRGELTRVLPLCAAMGAVATLCIAMSLLARLGLLLHRAPGEIGAFAAALPAMLRSDGWACLVGLSPALVTAAVILFVPRLEKIARRLMTVLLWAVCFLWCVVLTGGGLFYLEFQEALNNRAMGLFYDDTTAILGTASKEFGWWALLFGFLILPAGLAELARRGGKRLAAWPAAAVISFLPILAGVAGRPEKIAEWGSVKSEYRARDIPVVERLTENPVNLAMDIADRWLMGAPVPDFAGDVRASAHRLARGTKTESIPSLIMRRAPARSDTPRHVFLIVMESYDRCFMRSPFDSAGICTNLLDLERRGASSDRFVSAGGGTATALGSIIMGVPDISDHLITREARASSLLPTSIASHFRKLGYKTRFCYGGYAQWQRIAAFAKAHGFEESLCLENIPHPKSEEREWGIPDEYMWDALLAATGDDTPTFTLVMSTSFHPPYETDTGIRGIPPVQLPEDPAGKFATPPSPEGMAHLKYADKCLGDFVRRAETRLPGCVFAITGDHPSALTIKHRGGGATDREVPFVLYGKNFVTAGTKLPAGAHTDIAPTLLGLCSHTGYEYPAFGEDLFSESARTRPATYGNRTVAWAGGVYSLRSPRDFAGDRPSPEEVAAHRRWLDDWRALAWWYMNRSDTLPERTR